MTHKLLKRALVVLLSVVSISIDAQEKPVLWYDISLLNIGKRHYLWEMDVWEPWYMAILRPKRFN